MADHAIRLGINIPAKPPIGDVTMAVRLARLTGLDAALFWDHFQDFFPQHLWREELTWLAQGRPHAHEHYEYQVLLGYLASISGNMRIGVGVTEPLRRHPVLIAQALLTLAHLTKRAPILGLGAGEAENTDPYGVTREKAVGKVEEALQIIRTCFGSIGPFDIEGEHFSLSSSVMDLQPPKGRTPSIWLAAHGPRMLRLTGQYADAWYPSQIISPEEYDDKLATIRRHARDAGRDPEEIYPSLVMTTFLAPTDEDALEIMRSKIGRWAGLMLSAATWKQHGLRHPLGDDFQGYVDVLPEELQPERIDAALEEVPEDLMLQAFAWGTPERVAATFKRLGEVGLRHVVILPASVVGGERFLRYLPRGLFSLRRKLA